MQLARELLKKGQEQLANVNLPILNARGSGGGALLAVVRPSGGGADGASSGGSAHTPASEEARVNRFRQELNASCINLDGLKRLAFNGIPDRDNLRAVVWKVLLHYLPPSPEDWAQALARRRTEYHVFCDELIIDPNRSLEQELAQHSGALGAVAVGPLGEVSRGPSTSGLPGAAGAAAGAAAAAGQQAQTQAAGGLLEASSPGVGPLGSAAPASGSPGASAASSSGCGGGGGGGGGPLDPLDPLAPSPSGAAGSSTPATPPAARPGAGPGAGGAPSSTRGGAGAGGTGALPPPVHQLQGTDVTAHDHPLSLDASSRWNAFFQDSETLEQITRDVVRTHPDMHFFTGDTEEAELHRQEMRRALFMYAKLNPGLRYIQGMNELIAPLYYLFKNDPDPLAQKYAEADAFWCFMELISEFRDHFCAQLDNAQTGIRATIRRLMSVLQQCDFKLWYHIEVECKVDPQFYAFRWITLLLSQEFAFPDTLRIWDTILSDPHSRMDCLLRVCTAMILHARERLMQGDFTTIMKTLQRYPPVDVTVLLQRAAALGSCKDILGSPV